MQSKEPHITTAHIALICSALGWVSWGLIAIPGVIIAHTIKSHEPATSTAVKAALKVGYSSILIGLAALVALGLKYLGFFTRIKNSISIEEAPTFSSSAVSETLILSEEGKTMIANLAWTAGACLAAVIVLVLILRLFRKAYVSFQSARIIRSNSTRW
jgi:hypothetical protein